MKTRILLFDADGTLWDFDASAKVSMKYNFEKLGYTYSDEVFARYTVINNGLWERFERGEMPRDRVLTERFDLLFAELGINESGTYFESLFREGLEKNPFWMDGARDLLTKLRPDHEIHIVTNGVAAIQRNRIAATGMDRYVDSIFISEEIGAQKPQPAFFDYVLAHISPCQKEEIMLVGDSLTADILGAKQTGIPSCWFNPNHLPLTGGIIPDYEIHALSEVMQVLRS